MLSGNILSSSLPFQQIKVWVLAPLLETDDPDINYYYDFTDSIAEYDKAFTALDIEWKWQPVTIKSYPAIIEEIANEKILGKKMPIVFNLCDGDEINGTPGISVIRLLEQYDLIYTGADEFFYGITTSKIPMKRAFDKSNVPTPKWKALRSNKVNVKNLFDQLGSPVIVKPSVSGGSMGVGIKNVVYDTPTLIALINEMFQGYHGWDLGADGLIAESFISGREFTVLISGSYDNPEEAKIYTPVERVFHSSLPEDEKFLSFDRLWEIYKDESAMPNEANFFEYALPDESLIEDIKKISWEAYVATKGHGYTRVDVRMDDKTGQMFVLEANAQCGLSEDENFTSIGAILRISGNTFAELVVEIIADSLYRYSMKEAVIANEKPKRKRA